MDIGRLKRVVAVTRRSMATRAGLADMHFRGVFIFFMDCTIGGWLSIFALKISCHAPSAKVHIKNSVMVQSGDCQ
jgi:hypothetical protein